MEPLSIGQVAKQAGVGIETLRFYERQGLIDSPPRKESGYRQYPKGAVKRIVFIKRAKELGFSLKEIAELLSLKVDPSTKCADVKERAEEKISHIKDKIRTLKRMANTLKRLSASCGVEGPASECPILEALDK
ncbi:hypothetical protein MNBD_NITROSPINAE03-1642 [hydrothermal vent metagenome]|uniref:Mercuric resistance operon regulatory protein n=1 Tax=hydrothermal vent metagenome TaxID=652676 RepID=A0A3B1CA46_9ZZZZ